MSKVEHMQRSGKEGRGKEQLIDETSEIQDKRKSFGALSLSVAPSCS